MSALLRSAVVEDATARPRGVLGSAKWPKCCRVRLFLMLSVVAYGKITPPFHPPRYEFFGPPAGGVGEERLY